MLILGDAAVLGGVTLIGFARHQTFEAGVVRMLMTFLPWVIAWLLVAPHLGVFDEGKTSQWWQLWRPFWAMILASPLAAFLRALWLGGLVRPIFVVVLGGVAALTLTVWRGGYWLVVARKGR